MPQLNPGPWFCVLAVMWLTFLTVAPQMLLSHLFPNKITPAEKLEQSTNPWSWQWQ
uniref:ATP synthase F0 subunit 8 n=1 Tax=Pleuronichthys coenosus TaxID=269452 RepID=UPI0028D2C2AC|nr:ATP synthase F0 subunit 8 [Pleuronichthys coenosus]WMY90348.1 ATP synthase F0 subunit 8 [Pleuronichthys coenosus]